jgi:hypothetical protein
MEAGLGDQAREYMSSDGQDEEMEKTGSDRRKEGRKEGNGLDRVGRSWWKRRRRGKEERKREREGEKKRRGRKNSRQTMASPRCFLADSRLLATTTA